jgi:hypothetical protein
MENKKRQVVRHNHVFLQTDTIGTEKSASEMKEILLHFVWFCGNLISTQRWSDFHKLKAKMK